MSRDAKTGLLSHANRRYQVISYAGGEHIVKTFKRKYEAIALESKIKREGMPATIRMVARLG